jgi:hypothetical protein
MRMVRHGSSHVLVENLDVACFLAFRPNATLKRDALVFGQAFETGGLDVLEVGEQVRTACIWRNKAEAFSVVKPFNNTSLLSAHEFSFSSKSVGKVALRAPRN